MLFAKILTYALNAYTDAQIAEELVTFNKSKGNSYATKHSVFQTRAEIFVTETNKLGFKNSVDFLIGGAYTQYYINGLADILYANLLWHFYISKKKDHKQDLYTQTIQNFRNNVSTKYHFKELSGMKLITYWYWPVIVADPWHWAEQFARTRCGFNGTLNKAYLKKACLVVQKQNIQNNLLTAQILTTNTKSSDPKVIALRTAAKQTESGEQFLKQSASTLEAAAGWDKLFSSILNK